MTVNPKDGRCRSCGGALEILDCDDVSLNVACLECGDNYVVETDALNDGGIHYYPAVMAEKLRGGDEE